MLVNLKTRSGARPRARHGLAVVAAAATILLLYVACRAGSSG